MFRILFFALLMSLPFTAQAAFDPALLEQIGNHYRTFQKGLETYAVTVNTDKVGEMITRMTADLPSDVPRPETPLLTKYWSRAVGASVVVASGHNLLPTMREMVDRFSREYAVDLPLNLLPADQAGQRAALFRQGALTVTETHLDHSRRLDVALHFAAPVDLNGAFFGRSLPVPQHNVKDLNFDLDPDRGVLYQVDFVTADNQRITLEIRNQTHGDRELPTELRVTSPDGRIDDRLQTVMGEAQGYWLPLRQIRSTNRPGRKETVTVTFTDYRLNLPLPPEVLRLLGPG